MGKSRGGVRPVGLVILAAGASTRLGRPKQLLPYRGRSLLRHAAETAAGSTCRPILVVLGAHAAALAGELSDLPVRAVENPRWPRGMGTSLRAGLEALEAVGPEVGAVVFTLCDQPRLSSATIDSLVRAHRDSGRLIVASEYGGVLGVPALFDRALFGEILALQEASGAKAIIAKRRPDVCGVPFPEGAVDIDTLQDYEQLHAAAEDGSLREGRPVEPEARDDRL
jgi:molybdenum cofactor cytidylyltransferase